MEAHQYADKKRKTQTRRRKTKINPKRKNRYRISNANEMSAEELIHALRDKIQEIL